MTSHPLFDLDNAENWIKSATFHIFLVNIHHKKTQENSGPITALRTDCIIKIESDAVPPHAGAPSVSLGKRKASTTAVPPKAHTPEYICISSDSDSETHSLLTTHKNSKRRKKSRVSRSSDTIDLTKDTLAQPRGESLSDDQSDQKEAVRRPPAQVRKPMHIKAGSGNAIRITKKDSVEKVENLDHIPTIWDVSHRPTAYLIDLSHTTVSDQHDKSIISLIRHDVSTELSIFICTI